MSGALVAGLASPASALAIRLTSSAMTLTVQDNDANDDLPTNDFIQFNSTSGSLFPNWAAIVASASTCFFECPRMDGTMNAENINPSFLVLEITTTDLTLMPTMWSGQHSITGVTDASVTMEAFWDAGNVQFARTSSIGGPFTHANTVGFESFAADLYTPADGFNPFSMTTVITFNHGAGNQNSQATSAAEFTAVSAVPIPAALPLLGAAMGILGLAGFRRRT